MVGKLQSGIYYGSDAQPPNSYAILFLRASQYVKGHELGIILKKIWENLMDLEKGIVYGLDINPYRRYHGNLSVLIGYGPDVFSINGVKRQKPQDFQTKWMFSNPNDNGGGIVVTGSGLSYAKDVVENHAKSDHIVSNLLLIVNFIYKSNCRNMETT